MNTRGYKIYKITHFVIGFRLGYWFYLFDSGIIWLREKYNFDIYIQKNYVLILSLVAKYDRILLLIGRTVVDENVFKVENWMTKFWIHKRETITYTYTTTVPQNK